jgi:hypothetical protein
MPMQKSVNGFEGDRDHIATYPSSLGNSREGYSERNSATLEVRMVVDAAQRRVRFQEEIWKLLAKKMRQGPTEILRVEVEVIGASLGLTEEEACSEFLGLRGLLWDVRSAYLFASTIPPVKGEDPPRNWFAFTDAYLL